MARYSDASTIDSDAYQSMSESYHEQAQAYLDMVLRDSGIDPEKLSQRYDVLTRISGIYAQEKYLLDRMASNPNLGDIADRLKSERVHLERTFLPGVIDLIQRTYSPDTTTQAVSVRSGQIYRT